MQEHFPTGFAIVLVLGMGAQWLSWKARLPSILALLAFGFAAGLSGLDTDTMLGDLLFPVVSLSVAIILFEGGLGLHFSELKQTGGMAWRLVTVGAAVTWLAGTAASRYVLGLEWDMAFLLGAILVVSGPTVVLPLLRHVRPSGNVGPVLKWEAILIDPIGAMLAVLVFEAVTTTDSGGTAFLAVEVVFKTAVVGGTLGIVGAAFLLFMLKRYWIPDHLENAVTLAVVVAAFSFANAMQPESGLLAVTVLGIFLANQKSVPIRHVVEFKEDLRVLLISILFVLLAARIQPGDIAALGWAGAAFLAVLVAARPLAVVLCSIGSGIPWSEKAFLSWVAPRGIVAAAVSSILALRLAEAGHDGAQILVPATFLVIVGTAAIYGLTAGPLARLLGVARPDPQGTLVVGACPLARAVGLALREEGYRVLLVDNNWDHVSDARMDGLDACFADILSDDVLCEVELGGVGRLLAVTPNDEVNWLASMHFSDLFGKAGVYQLAEHGDDAKPHHLRGRTLFGKDATYEQLVSRIAGGAIIKKTNLTDKFDWVAFREHNVDAVPMFVLDDGKVFPIVVNGSRDPKPGQAVVFMRPAESG